MSSSLPSSSALHNNNNSADGNNNSIIDPSVGTHKTETTTTNTYNTRSNKRKRQAATAPTNTSSNSSSEKPKCIKNYHNSNCYGSSRNTNTHTHTTKKSKAEKVNSDDSNLDGAHENNLNLNGQHETSNTGMANGKILIESGTSFFSAVYEKMKTLKNDAIESEEVSQYENFFVTIKNTPYLYDCKYNPNIKTNVDVAFGLIQDISNISLQRKELVAKTKRSDDNDNNNNNIETAEDNTKIGKMDDDNDGIEIDFTLAEQERDIYSKLDSSAKKGFIAVLKQREVFKKEHEVEKKEREVEKKINFISDELVLIQKNTIEVSMQLHALAGLNQADGSCTSSSSSNLDSIPSDEYENRGVNFINPKDLDSTIFSTSDDNDIEHALNGLTADPTDSIKEHLKKVARNFNDFLLQTKFLDNPKKYGTGEYTQKVQKGLVALEEKFTAASAEPDSEKIYAPGATGHEVEGTQPYLKLILNVIGQFRNCQSSASSPAKNFVVSEVPITPVNMQIKPIIDFIIKKDCQWEAVMFDDMLTIPIKVKAGSRGREGPLQLLTQATEQCVSQLAKSIRIGFNFAEYGVPSHATGIVANMAALRVIHLKYEYVGSPDVKLKLYQSKLLPLMTRNSYQKWAKSAGKKYLKKYFEEFENELFGSNRKKDINDQIPEGMIVLCNLLCKSSRELYGLDLVPTEEDYMLEPIGFGTSSVVFRHKSRSKVIKLSRYGYHGDIQHEREILQQLKQDSLLGDGYHKHLSFLAEDRKELKVKLSTVEKSLPSLVMGPAGKPATLLFSSQENIDKLEQSLGIVYEGIKAALEHLHKNKFVHGDVAPKNIIIVEEKNRKKQAVLVDFSLSSKLGTTFTTLRGTLKYMHREIFYSWFYKTKPWSSEEKHDFAGLGFTLAYFANSCICPSSDIWNSLKYTRELDLDRLRDVMQERFENSSNVLNRITNIDQNLKKDLENLLAQDL